MEKTKVVWSFSFNCAHEVDDHARRLRIQVGRRLVGDHQGRLVHQGPGNGDPLLLPSRHLEGTMVHEFRKTHLVEPVQGLAPASLSDAPLIWRGSITFSRAESTGTRLKPWKMKPMVSLRISLRLLSESDRTSVPPIDRLPPVGSSMAPMRLRRVVLPEPEGPHMAINSPLSICKSTPRRAAPLFRPNDNLSLCPSSR